MSKPALATPKPFVPDPRQPLARQLYQLLLERICRFELEPGRLISEASLSATLGVSRTPVREAMARLAEQGLVEVMPQRGSRVLPLRRSDLEKSQFMREALETAMLRKVMAIADRQLLLMQLDKEITCNALICKWAIWRVFISRTRISTAISPCLPAADR
jgi:DNA-binding GntR family transcriptional regulator